MVGLGSLLGKKGMWTWLTSSTLNKLDDLQTLFIRSNSLMRAKMSFLVKLKAKICLEQAIWWSRPRILESSHLLYPNGQENKKADFKMWKLNQMEEKYLIKHEQLWINMIKRLIQWVALSIRQWIALAINILLLNSLTLPSRKGMQRHICYQKNKVTKIKWLRWEWDLTKELKQLK